MRCITEYRGKCTIFMDNLDDIYDIIKELFVIVVNNILFILLNYAVIEI